MSLASTTVRELVRYLGFDLQRIQSVNCARTRRAMILRAHGVDLVLDVGANIGQFALELRQSGYRGRIISFEPLKSAYSSLVKQAAGDPAWETRNLALGDVSGDATINVAQNLASSSLLAASDDLELAAPAARTIGQEQIKVERLDGVLRQPSVSVHRRILLKIDAQGFEKRIIESAAAEIVRIHALQVELALTPSYREQPTWKAMLALIGGHGFALVNLEPGFADPRTGELREFDAMFVRRERE